MPADDRFAMPARFRQNGRTMNRKRFVAALLRHETNTFSPVPTPVSAFGRIGSTDGPARGEEAVRVYRGTNNPLAAFIDIAEREGAALAVPIAANAHPSAPAPDDILDLVSEAIVEAVREGCDALFLDLHGAMATEGFDDGEGELLRRIRAEAPELPIAVALDFHTNLTRDLALLPTVLAGYRTYPHIDMYETGMRAGEALLRAMAGEASATAWHSLPLLPHMNVHSPSRPPMQAIVDRARAAEESGEVLLASVFGCFPLADIEHVGISAVVVGPADRAERLVLDLMGEAWDKRAEFLFEIEPMADSIARAAGMTDGDGPVLLVDHGDNTGSGGNQDVMAALRECLRQGLTGMVAGPFADPQAVAEMIAAGVGAEVEVEIGGKTDMPAMGLKGEPLRLRGRVRRITDGAFTVTGPMFTGVRLSLGRTAVLDTGRGRGGRFRRPLRALRYRLLHPLRHRPGLETLCSHQVAPAFPGRVRADCARDRDAGRAGYDNLGLRPVPLEEAAPPDLSPRPRHSLQPAKPEGGRAHDPDHAPARQHHDGQAR